MDAEALLLVPLRDPRDMLVDWLAFGTPVRFVFKEGENPFKGRRNVLTDRQVERRKRLLRHARRKG